MRLFNGILNSGRFPKQWTEGILIPLHKNGCKNDVNNYRGITLVSCFSKLFTTILNKRIESFCEKNNKLSDAQFGFRKGCSRVDTVFVLLSLIQAQINEGNGLYVVFVDLMKCFDIIYRNGLWLKLFKTGVQGKLLRIICDMYSNVRSCIKSCASYSDFFNYAVGLRQGEVMSPLLFSLFIEDLELFLMKDLNSCLTIDDITFILLLFADDMALIGRSPAELQSQLNRLQDYCDYWGLKVNTVKTKIMVFRKRGRLHEQERWTYNDQVIEVVEDFNYLGVVFNHTGNFALNQQHLIGKALKALNLLLYKCKQFDLKPSVLCQLFDSFVGSILGYAAEIWGYTKSKDIERVHLKFCKRLLNVRINTCNSVVYGELGRCPLYINRYVRMIKYWLRIVQTDNILLKTIYNRSLLDTNRGPPNWVTNIKRILDEYGMTCVFNDYRLIDAAMFLREFKMRVIDSFKTEWFSSINKSTVLDMYCHFKSTICYENYLDIIPRHLRFYFTRLRASIFPLRIQIGRYGRNRVTREQRHCQCCEDLDIEHEYHFICICNVYSEIRKKYLKRYYFTHPSVYKYHQLLKSSNRQDNLNIT